VRVYKLTKIFTICVSVQKVPVASVTKQMELYGQTLNGAI